MLCKAGRSLFLGSLCFGGVAAPTLPLLPLTLHQNPLYLPPCPWLKRRPLAHGAFCLCVLSLCFVFHKRALRLRSCALLLPLTAQQVPGGWLGGPRGLLAGEAGWILHVLSGSGVHRDPAQQCSPILVFLITPVAHMSDLTFADRPNRGTAGSSSPAISSGGRKHHPASQGGCVMHRLPATRDGPCSVALTIPVVPALLGARPSAPCSLRVIFPRASDTKHPPPPTPCLAPSARPLAFRALWLLVNCGSPGHQPLVRREMCRHFLLCTNLFLEPFLGPMEVS